MSSRARLAALLLAPLLASAPALAQTAKTPEVGAIGFGIAVGPEFGVGGEFHGGGTAGIARIGSRTWTSTHEYFLGLEGEVTYGLSDLSELALTLGYTRSEAESLGVGELAGVPLRAKFDDYEAWTARLSYRQYFQVSPGFYPYVGVTAGVRRVGAMDAEFRSGGFAQLTLPAELGSDFYKSSWVPTGGLTFGWRSPYAGVVLGLETGIFYDGELRDDDSTLAALGLNSINDEGGRWYIPVKLSVNF
ncbi:hypothetical protein HHL28_13675 [Aerophototrophica crusticola]|uniref:Outer membrane protein beta-barrel domain-containing protein n=1 Tax=Aerophototrophica crusticola TaxID=1709002 RepID=A0A858RA37_9PROT|nr:hypothetical protein HHL28_13675 [Rhodospirillaceae bacterium B3]